MRKKFQLAVITLAGVAAVMQFFQPEWANPPADPAASFESAAAPSPQLAALVERACKDCHSNQTTWPWYSRVAPVSWLVADDVRNGRARLNLSEWSRFGPEMSRLRLKAMCAEVKAGEMPPLQYKLMHPGARLSDADVSLLCSAAASH